MPVGAIAMDDDEARVWASNQNGGLGRYGCFGGVRWLSPSLRRTTTTTGLASLDCAQIKAEEKVIYRCPCNEEKCTAEQSEIMAFLKGKKLPWVQKNERT